MVFISLSRSFDVALSLVVVFLSHSILQRWRSGCGDKKVGESVQQQLLREGLKSVEMLSVLSAEDLVP
jgi:hypothetical protein